LLDSHASSLQFYRIALTAIASAPSPITMLRDLLFATLDRFSRPLVALIDSPRAPCDCDCRSLATPPPTSSQPALPNSCRLLDDHIRAFARRLNTPEYPLPLSLFPTPPLDYFRRCLHDPQCKPHLRALGRDLFGSSPPQIRSAPRGGAIFTRFMLSGFAAYRALDSLGVTTFEAYPDLQFRLSRRDRPLIPKRHRTAAFADRLATTHEIAALMAIDGVDQIRTLDQADATILALSARLVLDRGLLAIIAVPAEGRFAIALPPSPAPFDLQLLSSQSTLLYSL
jgi:hypothetical protein